MKKILSCLLGLLVSLVSFSQNSLFEELVRKSLLYFEQHEFQKFEEVYPSLYIAYLKANIPSYQEAVDAANDGNTELAISHINELVDEDLFIDEIENDENFTALHKNKAWTILLEKVQSIKDSYNEKTRKELKDVQNRDQGIRLLYLNTKNDSLKRSLHSYMKTVVDQDCSTKIGSILDKYGWLSADKIGSEANETLFLGIQHVDNLIAQEKYLPMLRSAVEQGDADGWHLAFLTDRILMNQGKKQIYGTQKIISSDPEKSYIIPLENPDKVDELRNSMGLPPLEEELKEEGISWNIEEYKKNSAVIEEMYREYHERTNSKER